ncbi:hypothetical protein PMAYCL1PPCAC_23657, partial [Pristionchus mayeri]
RVNRDEDGCAEASKLTCLNYEAMERKRDKIGHLYVSVDPTLLWNGNTLQGYDDICKFIQQLPQTDHNIQSVDAQRLPSITETSDLPEGIVMNIAGTVTMGLTSHGFVHNFVLMREDAKLKVCSWRLRDSYCREGVLNRLCIDSKTELSTARVVHCLILHVVSVF